MAKLRIDASDWQGRQDFRGEFGKKLRERLADALHQDYLKQERELLMGMPATATFEDYYFPGPIGFKALVLDRDTNDQLYSPAAFASAVSFKMMRKKLGWIKYAVDGSFTAFLDGMCLCKDPTCLGFRAQIGKRFHNCGVYAFNDISYFQQYNYPPQSHIYAVVMASGRVDVRYRGWRAERAEIVAFICDAVQFTGDPRLDYEIHCYGAPFAFPEDHIFRKFPLRYMWTTYEAIGIMKQSRYETRIRLPDREHTVGRLFMEV